MFYRFLSIVALVASALPMLAIATPAQASFYYDESYYNWPIPCYEYDQYGHCLSSSYRYRASRVVDPVGDTYYHNNYPSSAYYNYNGYNNNGNYGNYGNSYPYGYSNARPMTNVYQSSFNNDCYWSYGTYRCDQGRSNRTNCNR